MFLFEAHCRPDRLVYIVWQKRDTFFGEDQPAVKFVWPAILQNPKATDALGKDVAVDQVNDHLTLMVSNTPIFVYSSTAQTP
jgi:hypothetical protein